MLRAISILAASLSLAPASAPGPHAKPVFAGDLARSKTAARLCAGERPRRLTFSVRADQPSGILHWRSGPKTPHGSGFRVLRDNRVVGQTRTHAMPVDVKLGHAYTLKVFPVSPAGRVLRCASARLRLDDSYRLPSAPPFPSAAVASPTSVTLSWQPSHTTGAAIIGYRVLRDGAVYGQTKADTMTVKVAANRTYSFTVIAVDQDGQLSPPSVAVRVTVDHAAPPAPGPLDATAVGSTGVQLSWTPSTLVTGRLDGYRVLQNGVTVGQFSGTSVTFTNLRPSTTYTYAVEAVDTLGYVSAPSSAVPVRTGDPEPPSAPGSLIGAAESDSVVELSWQPSVPQQGRIIGYRVAANGAVVGQFDATSAQVTDLAASSTYTFSVTAIDSLGDVGVPSTITVQTSNPTPTTGHVFAFLLADTDESFEDFQAHYQDIGTVIPTYYDCNHSNDELTGGNVPLITQWAQARGVKVMPRFDCQGANYLDTILRSPTLVTYWLNAILAQVNANDYDGITLDFEAGMASDRNAFTAFVTSLAAELHADGKQLVVAVSPKTADVNNNPRSTFFDYNALSAQADELFVMAWGIHWTTSAPGAEDDMTWESQVIHYISTLPRTNKYVLGIELYAMDWASNWSLTNPATEMEYEPLMSFIASVGATPTYSASADAWTFTYTDSSGIVHTVWYPTAGTEGDRIALAKANGFGGIGVWRLGEEDQDLWSNPEITGSW